MVWITIGIVVLLAAVAATITAFAKSGPGKISVSPTANRPSAAGHLADLRLPTPMSVTPPADPFAGLTITDNKAEHKLEITIADVPENEFKPAFDVFEAKKVEDWVVTPAGRVRLVAIGVADPAAVPDDERYAPVTYYRPTDLTELALEDLPIKQRMARVYIQSNQIEPSFRFVFELDGFDQPDAIGYDIYDAATEVGLSSGYGWSTVDDSAYVEMDLPVWHGPAIELAMDLAHGPVIAHEIQATPGEYWRHGPLHVEVLRRLDKEPGGMYSQGTNDGRYHGRIHYRDDDSSSTQLNGLLVGILPRRNIGGLDLDLVDADGNPIRDRAHVYAGEVRYLAGEVAANEIAALRVKWRPHFKRLIWRVPALPVVGAANRGVTDLAQVRIAQAAFERQWQLQNFIEDALQIDVDHSNIRSHFKPPAGYFPVTFEDTTPGAILDDYLRHVAIPPDHRAVLDQATMTLTVKPTWYGKLRAWLDQHVGGWF